MDKPSEFGFKFQGGRLGEYKAEAIADDEKQPGFYD